MSRSKCLVECVTLTGQLCASYPNCFPAHTHWRLAGLRLAEDAWPPVDRAAVSRDRVSLDRGKDCEDRWSHLDEPLPPCRPVTTDGSIHTVIGVPIHYRRKLGIYYFETREYIDLSEIAKNELQLLASALGWAPAEPEQAA